MADRHIDTGGATSSPYATWANAAATWSGANSGSAAGDNFYVGSSNSESAASYSITFPGTPANPNKMISGTKDTTSGLTARTAGATFTATGTSSFVLSGCAYVYGIRLVNSGAGANDIHTGAADGSEIELDTCHLEQQGTASGSTFRFGTSTAGGGARVVARDCTFKTAHISQVISYMGELHIVGGSWASGGSSPTGVFSASGTSRGGSLLCEKFDFTNCGTSFNLHANGQGGVKALFRNITVANSWTGAPVATANAKAGQTIECVGITSGSTYYRYWSRNARGDVRDETTYVRSGGSADAIGTYSLKLDSTANVAYPHSCLWSPYYSSAANNTTGSSVSLTIELLVDNASNINNKQVVAELISPDGQVIRSIEPNPLASATDYDNASSESWTTTSMSNPKKFKIVLSHTPTKAGPFLVRVGNMMSDKNVYFDTKFAIA
jgi:hypothetical protein